MSKSDFRKKTRFARRKNQILPLLNGKERKEKKKKKEKGD